MSVILQERNLWEETGGLPIKTPDLLEEKYADVVIVGGGFTGFSAALTIAEERKSVVLLEANTIGFGGAGRNVGLVNKGLWTEPEKVQSILGKSEGEKLNSMLAVAPDLVFDNIKKYHIDCEAIRTGTLHCAHSKSGLADLKERLRQYHAIGIDAELLSKGETKEKIGSSIYCGSLLQHGVGTIQPLAYVRGMARAAISAGACIYQNTNATRIERQGETWCVHTSNGKVNADAVILATNAYHRDLITLGKPRYTPVHYFQAATDPLSEDVARRILPEKQGCWDTATIMSSFRKDEAGRLIVGGVGSLEHSASFVHRKWAKHKICSLFPFLDNVKIQHAWHGRIAYTSDNLPHLVNFGPNAMSIFGYSGRGIGPGTLFGKAIAEFLLTNNIGVLPIEPEKSHSEVFTAAKKMFYEFGSCVVHGVEASIGR